MKILQVNSITLEYLTKIVNETDMKNIHYFFNRHGNLPIVQILDKNNEFNPIQFEFNTKTVVLNPFGSKKITEEIITQDSFSRMDESMRFNELFDVLKERCYEDLQVQKCKTLSENKAKNLVDYINSFLHKFIK